MIVSLRLPFPRLPSLASTPKNATLKIPIPLYILEIIVLIGAVCVLYVTLKATDSKTGAQKDNLKEENIAVNQEVKEKIDPYSY